jgi:hypothetical protein
MDLVPVLLVFGLPALLFAGVGYALTGGRRPSSIPRDPDLLKEDAPEPLPPQPPMTLRDWYRFGGFLLIGVALAFGIASLPDTPIWTLHVASWSFPQRPAQLVIQVLCLAAAAEWTWAKVRHTKRERGWSNLAAVLAFAVMTTFR